jgi:putative lipoic acid-binding regulatory protein
MQDLNLQQLIFPVKWHYKIITDANTENILDDINRILSEHGVTHQAQSGNFSSNRKYLTYKVTVEFFCREEMERLSLALRNISGVKYLI